MYNLIDYKGKFTIIQDKDMLDDLDIVVGRITHEDAVRESEQRKSESLYYGVPAYIGHNGELFELYE